MTPFFGSKRSPRSEDVRLYVPKRVLELIRELKLKMELKRDIERKIVRELKIETYKKELFT